MLFYTCFPVFCLIGVAFSVFQSQKGEEETTWLPESLRESGSPGQLLWKNQIVKDSDASRQMPNTGVTRHYDFQVSRKSLAPDGYTKNLLVANGQFPGPLIEANWGDFIEGMRVEAVNGERVQDAYIHFPKWSSVTTYLIPRKELVFTGTVFFRKILRGLMVSPVSTNAQFHRARLSRLFNLYNGYEDIAELTGLSYRFRADLYGTSWYHSHFGAQFSGGLFGPMIIHGPSHVDFDIDLGPILLSDCECPVKLRSVLNCVSRLSQGLPPNCRRR